MSNHDDDYDDDFSDPEYYGHQDSHSRNNNHDSQDEQAEQKVNGRIESLEIKIEELKRELDQERNDHSRTIKILDSTRDELMKMSTSVVSVGAQSSLSTELKSEIFNCGLKNSISVNAQDPDELTEAECMHIVKTISKLCRSKQDGKSVINSNDAENRIRNLENELRLALAATEDIRALKAKVLYMMERARIEKEGKLKAESNASEAHKKVAILGDHMEKLMATLRLEVTSKIRALEQVRQAERNLQRWKDKHHDLSKKMQLKERLVAELQEGSRILEDQLALMDEKYLDLRSKLDWTRDHGMKKIREAEKQAKDLRVKYLLANGRVRGLDSIPLPSEGILSTDISVSSEMYSKASSINSKFGGSQGSLTDLLAKQKSILINSSINREPNIDEINEKLKRKTGQKGEYSMTQIREICKNAR
jgi:hypothetical protein